MTFTITGAAIHEVAAAALREPGARRKALMLLDLDTLDAVFHEIAAVQGRRWTNAELHEAWMRRIAKGVRS